ncbi:hypothetical protein PHYSODRAFT_286703 [Phytophthora sojae]|uniref:RxLR effector protein Avh331 n=1 Tax=Phytophthora sojae (strain P6497) TaxID=1094619 RepID=AV331_PHYSP|nr:hypothetical protein PHYSODRAFT_286703 [Phytophthora sojae]G4ZRQ7.1 RecName: Full=RxLR effector protein Avh331; AltName: Full=Avirulence homolog protein 1k; AltName: Full=Avirulence homolog protein 331; Flags: Precursor [Phytophthora sojae strain P6497]ABZ10806.1 Avh331 [Phytophthora sojae]AGC95071.1 Avr1k [Phytophthora sojae]AGC95072.1 Avr1k [Phytophthora sojae]AGC95073.1 Avr1k [Phytophthora sojae]EGZ13866.1 hypothetical protein PHYSODRAFT_286703 [Phytophthora sojae]|eukprot:XP_009531295.1 hypothetical protein PHYSODRAFT_286703 [Phytophthora sojae]
MMQWSAILIRTCFSGSGGEALTCATSEQQTRPELCFFFSVRSSWPSTISDGACLALVSAEQGATAGRNTLSLRSMMATEDMATSTRSLRSQATNVDDDANVSIENRGMNPSVLTKLGEFASTLTAGNTANKLWLMADVDPKSAFKLLGLDMPGVRFIDNPKMLQWLKFTKAYLDMKKSGFGETSAHALLYEKIGGPDLSLLLLSLKDAPDANSLVQKLTNSQFGMWHDARIEPEQLAQTVFKIQDVRKLPKNDPKLQVIDDYAKYHRKHRKFLNSIMII